MRTFENEIFISEIYTEENVFILNNPIKVSIYFDKWFVIEYPEMGIIVCAENKKDLMNEFYEDFNFLWRVYGEGDESIMCNDAIELKKLLISKVKEVKKIGGI